MYEQLKDLPDFSEYCDEKYKYQSSLPSISEIRRRHYLMQGECGLNLAYDNNLSAFRRRVLNDDLEISSKPSRSYYLKNVYSKSEFDPWYISKWNERDRSIERIVDENTNRPTRFYFRGIDNLDFVAISVILRELSYRLIEKRKKNKMGLSTKYTWAEFYPGFMNIQKPVRHFTKNAYVPHYLYAPSLYNNYNYSSSSPYTSNEFSRRTDETLGRTHYYLDGNDLNYLHLIDRPLYFLPSRKSFYARMRDRVY